jgi:hypothetical protein
MPAIRPGGQPRGAPPYLMGNHVIAERMYRHNPEVILNVPPRTRDLRR